MPDALNLLMFVELVWSGTWYSRHHLIRGLAQKNHLVVVDSPPEWRDVVRQPRSALRGGRVVMGEQNVLRYAPPRYLPEIYRGAGLRRSLTARRMRTLSRDLERAGMHRPIAYVWHPLFQREVSLLGDVPLVYHAYDKYDHYDGSENLREQEEWLARRADLCVAPSTELANYLRGLGARHVLELPHAVDVNLFRPSVAIAPELASVPKPIIGLVARINEVLDSETLRHVATSRPDWSIVFVGPAIFTSDTKRKAFEALCELPNVYHFGQRPRPDIPSWMCGFDVGLMCYDREAWGAYVQPIKMYEYLACGLPIVSTSITAARELSRYIRCCNTLEDWIPQLGGAIQEQTPDLVGQRLAFVKSNSWEQRVAVLDASLHEIAERHAQR
jgi:glycosyltransferase involved in cell wall biosynthesis